MYSDVQMSFRKSERSMQTSNNKISVSSKDSKCLGTVRLIIIGLLRLVAYIRIELKFSDENNDK